MIAVRMFTPTHISADIITTITILVILQTTVTRMPVKVHHICRLMFSTRAVILPTAAMVTTTSHRAAVTTTTVHKFSYTFCMV